MLTHYDTERLPLSYLGTSQEPSPRAASAGHRKAFPELARYDRERLPPRYLRETQKGFPRDDSAALERSRGATRHGPTSNFDKAPRRRLGLLPRISAVSTRYQHTPGDEWENSWRANRNGLAYNVEKTPRLATLEESAADPLESPKKAQMLPDMPQRSPRELQGTDLTPTHSKHLGLLLPCKSLGWLPAQFSCLQGRPKHSGRSSEES